jgi:hypothetical protein
LPEIAYVAIAVAIALVVLLAIFYLRAYLRNRALGSPGLASRVRLDCPKCRQTFDYDFVPGASLTAVRLGTSRYMACPLCHKWSVFDLTTNRIPSTEPGRP